MRQLLFLLMVAAAALAQDVRLGEVSGEVMDMMGKPVVNAEVVYRNTDNGKTYHLHTGKDGRFFSIGIMLGTYQVEITGPTGKHIYSGQKTVYAGDKKALNVVTIDLSIIATKASLVPFKGPNAADLQKEEWRKQTEESLRDLTPEQVAELRDENALIARYNELTPKIQSALKDQNWSLASGLLQELIAIAPYKWELYQNLATIELFLGNYREAIKGFEKGIRVMGEDPEARKDRTKTNAALAQMMMAEGEAYAALDELDAAANQHKHAIEKDPKLAIAYAHLCVVAYNNGRPEAAIAACKQALAADPNRLEFYQTLAQIQSNLEKYEDAIQTYERGIHLAEAGLRQSEAVHSNINTVKESRQTPEFSGAATYKTRVGQMLLSEGNAYFQLRQFKKAADLFSQAAVMHPHPSLAYFNLCATLFNMDNLKDAVAACDNAITLDPERADAYFVKASALLGDAARHHDFRAPQSAISALEKYLQLAPDGGYSGEANSLLREMAGRR